VDFDFIFAEFFFAVTDSFTRSENIPQTGGVGAQNLYVNNLVVVVAHNTFSDV
jgi:hypothetical protein